MKEIDFLPAWHIAARTRRKDFAVRGVYLGVVLAAMGVLSVLRYGQLARAEQSLARVQSELYGSSEAILSPDAYRARWKELERRQKVLAEIEGGAPVHAFLAELSAVLPSAAVLASLQVIEPPRLTTSQPAPGPAGSDPRQNDGRLELQGWAASDGEVGDLISRMSGSGAFADVKLGYSKPVRIEGREAREFKVACRLPSFE